MAWSFFERLQPEAVRKESVMKKIFVSVMIAAAVIFGAVSGIRDMVENYLNKVQQAASAIDDVRQ